MRPPPRNRVGADRSRTSEDVTFGRAAALDLQAGNRMTDEALLGAIDLLTDALRRGRRNAPDESVWPLEMAVA